MKRDDLGFLAAVIAPLLLSLAMHACSKRAAAGWSAPQAPALIPYVTDIAKQEQEAWEQACLVMQHDCTVLERPEVVYEPMSGWGYFRWFSGELSEQKIHVDESVKGQVFAKYIMVHEYAHYMEFADGWMKEYSTAYRSGCERERMAFWAEGVAAIMDDYRDPRVDSWEEVKHLYKCP